MNNWLTNHSPHRLSARERLGKPYDLGVAGWRNRKSGQKSALSPEVVELLSAIDLTTVVLAPGEVPIYYSNSAVTLGIIKNDVIVPENLLALFRSEIGRAHV